MSSDVTRKQAGREGIAVKGIFNLSLCRGTLTQYQPEQATQRRTLKNKTKNSGERRVNVVLKYKLVLFHLTTITFVNFISFPFSSFSHLSRWGLLPLQGSNGNTLPSIAPALLISSCFCFSSQGVVSASLSTMKTT